MMKFADIFSLAFRTIRGNRLRTGLTVSIIAFGIMALVGIITAIEAMNQKFTESFSSMGASGFTIRYKARNIRFGGGGDGNDMKLSKKGKKKERTSNLDKKISRDQAELFLSRFDFPSVKSISLFGGRNSIVSYETLKTSPNVMVQGGDENFLALNGFTIETGRNMNSIDVQTGRNVCLLGFDVANKLFKQGYRSAVNKVVRVNSIPYRVLGVLESKGSSFGFSRDNMIVTSYNNVYRNFGGAGSFNIAIQASQIELVPAIPPKKIIL
jgi:putative ABC transport system permease protein